MSKLQLSLTINEDYIRFGTVKHVVRRPVRVSRSRWIAFWQHIVVRGLNVQAIKDADRFMKTHSAEETEL